MIELPDRTRDALPYGSIVCGVNDGPSDRRVVEQAVALAAPGARLEVLAVTGEARTALTAQAALTPAQARRAIAGATALTRGAGVRWDEHVVAGADVPAALLAAARAHDLLVVGGGEHSRLAGALLGHASTFAVHRAESDVLLARPVPDGDAFGARVLVAHDGTRASSAASRIAVALAARPGTEVTIAAPADLPRTGHHLVAELCRDIMVAGATAPVVVDVAGAPEAVLCDLAAGRRASLLVVGSRRLQGPRAVTSVSERVAHRAPCSVLIARMDSRHRASAQPGAEHH